ncbi:uncharacterized protein RHIMIDRAFT_257644 [Rhizopus microsporus ATCC 52813]|uniref:Uncharacterized protein n=1 Tax=Rhizopus microsporus ATCC 52813 TaxID=1340429 RepID=A0A2G4SRN3_RHIZD|nr:uncharacterized protein RHIMIDRAFT_257644 [Rhizopus microsporus ATCC 52813]PHZ11439.1 hypothetical protein RHIMIDRAFT_257644 [Rhizopus microsporus ATCC 52813]
MGLAFLAFCGYLINLMYHDRPLIQTSSEAITNKIDTPDIEFCVQNTTMHMVHCSGMFFNWTTIPLNDCWTRFFRAGESTGDTSRCYIFETNGTMSMATGFAYDNREAMRRIDFYWKIDDLQNISYASISTPAIAVQLYDPQFSPWKKYTIGDTPVEQRMLTNIRLGANRATTFLNYSSSIFYTPKRYRAIKPHDAASIFGFTPNYVDIHTLSIFQQNWPLAPSPPNSIVNRTSYHGFMSVQLAQSTIDVMSEVRQHTLLASLAMAGGCYGVLTTIYIILFGMTRLTPWGLVHHVPVMINNRKQKKGKQDNTEMYMSGQEAEDNKYTTYASSTSSILPWFFRSGERSKTMIRKQRRESDSTTGSDKGAAELREFNRTPIQENVFVPDSSIHDQNTNSTSFEALMADPFGKSNESPKVSRDPFSLPSLNDKTTDYQKTTTPVSADIQAIYDMLRKERNKNSELSSRVEELEVILAEYFIDTSYVDKLRGKSKALEGDADVTQRGNLP